MANDERPTHLLLEILHAALYGYLCARSTKKLREIEKNACQLLKRPLQRWISPVPDAEIPLHLPRIRAYPAFCLPSA